MVTAYIPGSLSLSVDTVTSLLTQGLGIGIVISFSLVLTGFVINKMILIMMGRS